MDELLKWRSEFPILENTIYMISNSLGAMPKAVYDKLREYGDIWVTRGVRAWEEAWWKAPLEVGNLVGKIIGAEPDEVTIQTNITMCESIIISCFDFSGKRNKIVFTDMNFPSIIYLYQQQTKIGAKLEIVKTEDGVTVPTEKVLDAIDEETLFVPISHVLFRSSYIQDVKAIIEKAHSVGAKVILDTYQSAGTVPIDVKELEVDFLVGGTLKWLCGGPGLAFMYVRPDLARELKPTLTGWMAHENPFSFDVGEMKWTEGSYRFQNGTPSIPGLYVAQPGLEIINKVGVEKIREKSKHQTDRLIELADEYGFEVTAPRNPEQRAGAVAVNVENGYRISLELKRREFIVDYRPKAGVRISPHFYSKDEELDIIMKEIQDIIATKAYERQVGVVTTVT